MYLYFDKFGVLKETINDGSVRMGDSESDKIYVYFENEPLLDGLWIMTKKPSDAIIDDKVSPLEFSFIENRELKEVPYEKNRDLKYFEDYREYNFYVYTIPSELLNENGLYRATIRAVSGGTIKAQGLITYNVQDSVINVDNGITYSQYQYLIKYISENFTSIIQAYLKSVDYDAQEYIFDFVNQSGERQTYVLPFKDVYAKIEQLDQDIRYNNIGLLDVSEYDEETGIITYIYNPSLIRKIDDSQLEETGIITIYARPLDWNEYDELRPSDEDRQIINDFEKGGNL